MGVQRVIDQLAHDRGGPLDHLARGDPLYHLTRQQRNPFRHGVYTPSPSPAARSSASARCCNAKSALIASIGVIAAILAAARSSASSRSSRRIVCEPSPTASAVEAT